MKKIIIISIILIIILLGGYFILYRSGESRSTEVQNTVYADNEPEKQINIVEAFGTVVVRDVQNISLDFPVKINEILLESGERAAKGDGIIILDYKDKKLELANLRRRLEDEENKLEQYIKNNRITLDKINNNLSTEKDLYNIEKKELEEKEEKLNDESSPDIARIKNELAIAARVLEDKEGELADKEKLLDAGAITQYNFDEFAKTVENQRDKYILTEMSLEELKYSRAEEIEQLKKSITIRERAINDIETKLKEQEVNHQYTISIQKNIIYELKEKVKHLEDKLSNKEYLKGNNIIACLDNVVIYNISCTEGDYKQAGERLFSLMSLDSMLVEAEVPEEFIKDVKEGASVNILPLAASEREYQGRVIKIYDLAEKRGGETIIPVDISIDNIDDFLLPNFNVDVEISRD